MKKISIKFLTILFFALTPIVNVLSQPLPDPESNANVLANGTQLNCNITPIGNGYLLLLSLAFAYGIYRIWQMRKAEKAA